MCNDCGCDEKLEEKQEIEINESVMEDNDKIAHDTRHMLFHKGILPINIMGSPGAGKTTFIENIANFIDADKIAVIQGDLESDIDKERLEKQNILTYQINTHSGCHLNAKMILDAINDMDLENKKILLIENVGNLVCPANIEIGQKLNILISSTTEGSDKPRKYPIIFNNSNALVISKCDLAEYVGFKREEYMADLKKINYDAEIFEVTEKEADSFKGISDYILKNQEEWEEKSKNHNH